MGSTLHRRLLLDACYLSAGDDDADPPTTVAELRTMINWLIGITP